jgi:L-threonylcarbamoyladenylate synthase
MMEKVLEALRAGKLVVYPTDTVYGLGADALSKEAVDRVYEVKQRPREQPISILVADFDMLYRYANVSQAQKKVLEEQLPGPYTFILEPKEKMSVSDSSVGFRIPKHWCTKIAKEFGKPITTTSANIHGRETPATITELRKTFGDRVEVYVDGGTLSGKPSTVIDLTTSKTVRI